MDRSTRSGKIDGTEFERLKAILAAESGDSRKLLEDVEDNPICSVSVDESVPCIVICWRQYATSAQLRFIHEHIIAMLAQRGLSKILGDDTELLTIHADDQTWIEGDWLPRAMAAGLKAAASKRPVSYFGHLSVSKVQSVVERNLPLRSFDGMAEARRWLKDVPV